jgi:hypothetical protein
MLLGGFAATLKFVMMMTLWGHAQTDVDARAKKTARAAKGRRLLGVMVGLAMICAGAKAETYTPHARRITSRYSTAHYVARRSNNHATNTRAGRAATSKASAASRRRERVRVQRSAPRREPVPSPRASVAERRSAHTAPPAMRRVNRRRGERHHRSDVPEVVAEAPVRDAEHAVGSAAALKNGSLSVNDVARAAGQQPTASSGVSQPEEPEDTETQRELAGDVVTASVDAPPSHPAPILRSAPSDLVGAPLTEPEHSQPHTTALHPDADVAPASHEELAEEAGEPVVLPGIYRYGRLVVPPPMRGTREILVHQNLMADEEGLSRIQDDFDLRRMRADRMLVDLPESASLHVNPELASDRRCARPWAVRFAVQMARSYYARFHVPLQVNSAVRTVDYQIRLRRVNGNAAGIGGETGSPHLTGEAIDFGKREMSTAQIAWMRTYLRPLMQAGKVDVEEEFQQACFHISVYRSYAPDMTSPHRATRREVAQLGEPRVARSHAVEP